MIFHYMVSGVVQFSVECDPSHFNLDVDSHVVATCAEPGPEIPFEVHNTRKVDPALAMKAVRDMCS